MKKSDGMYQINDTVLYGTNGICKITEISKREFYGKSIEYYILQPIYQNTSSIFIPVNNEALTSKIRRILSSDEIYSIIRSMPHEENIWIDDDNERKVKFSEILKTGDRKDLMLMIKTIYLRRTSQKEISKKIHSCDERFLNDAEKLLYEEFAHVLKIDRDDVLPLILQEIEIEEKKSLNNIKQAL
ncbi:MAG: CarD family transcriptional regulator [Bacillota bacterium]|nr:CarD family transcriptional regulator [Bacillota bacterium]